MKRTLALVVLVALSCACGAAAQGPNPNDRPGGAANMQPGSGGTYNDVLRSDGAQPLPPGDAPGGADAIAAPKREPSMPEPPPPTPPKQ